MPYSGSVSYPASKSGGYVSYHGTACETVEVVIEVDTTPFDGEVHDMKKHVDVLTGAVVASQTAQVMTKAQTSEQIGSTIVKGFFKTVRSDISQQITELRNNTDALILQLKKLSGQLADKKRQMGADYQRIVARYSKVFTDLNNELQNRIYSIDEPIFRTTRNADEVALKGTQSDMVAVASVSGAENARVASVISATMLKDRAMDAIGKGKRFLDVQYRTDAILDRSLRQGGEQATFSTPYCFMEATAAPDYSFAEVYRSPMLDNNDPERLKDAIRAAGWSGRVSKEDSDAIADYFNAEVANKIISTATGEHDRRVAAMTSKLFNLSTTEAPGK